MREIILSKLNLKTFTEQDALDYCLLNSLNPDNIIILYLSFNNLTDISEIKLFKNLEILFLHNNKIKDISIIQYLNKLELLDIGYNNIFNISVLKDLTNLQNLNIQNLELESDQIEYINNLKNLKTLFCQNAFKDRNSLNELNKNIKLV